MNSKNSTKSRKFAARYKSTWQGWVAAIFGFSFLSNSSATGAELLAIPGIALMIFSVYLFRGQELSPKQIERAKNREDKLQSKINDQANRLANATGGQAVVEYRKLEKIFKSKKIIDNQVKFKEKLNEINFDRSKIESELIGTIPMKLMINNDPIEIYKDWIISGTLAYDVDSSTRGEVHVDGSIQIDAKNNKRDMRTATLQFASTKWSHSFRIDPDQANNARRIVAQLATVLDSQKPSGVTTADIKNMIETILSNTGKSPAEKLQQLSDLRYQRLLTDQEFEAAKTKILGI